MNSGFPSIARLLLCAGLCLAASCNESEEQRIMRLEKAMENATITQRSTVRQARPEDEATQMPLTPEEKAANDPTKKLVLFCASNLNDPFQFIQAELMRASVRTLDGWRYKVFDAAGDMVKQGELLQQAENEKPVWTIVQPLDDRLVASMIEAQHGRGVQLISLDQRIPAGSCQSVIFVDQFKLGKLAGEVVVEALRRKAKDENQPTVAGRVVQIRGQEDSFEARARAEGFAGAIHAEPSIVLVHDAAGDWNAGSAAKIAQEALRLQSRFDVVFCHNDSMAAAASAELLKAQLRDQVLIVGIDGVNAHDGGIDLLRRGIIDATIYQPMPMETAFLHIQDSVKNPAAKLAPRLEREPVAVTLKKLDEFQRPKNAGK